MSGCYVYLKDVKINKRINITQICELKIYGRLCVKNIVCASCGVSPAETVSRIRRVDPTIINANAGDDFISKSTLDATFCITVADVTFCIAVNQVTKPLS